MKSAASYMLLVNQNSIQLFIKIRHNLYENIVKQIITGGSTLNAEPIFCAYRY